MTDDLAQILDAYRWEPATASARSLYEQDADRKDFCSGSSVANTYGPLLHFTSRAALDQIKRTGRLGVPACHLTPTAYSSWQASRELGLPDLYDRCLLVNVSTVPRLWGPGRAAPSRLVPGWVGGGLEFFVPEPISWDFVQQVFECGFGREHRRIDV
ncbi:MAG: hypothetical protein GC160_13220 [Acidobacteria bacterium]|nr:hypothetical protein [Acidobacteriota bacterium]